MFVMSGYFDDGGMVGDSIIRNLSCTEVCNHTAPYDYWGPSTRNHSQEQGGSIGDRSEGIRFRIYNRVEGTILHYAYEIEADYQDLDNLAKHFSVIYFRHVSLLIKLHKLDFLRYGATSN